jgi:DNA repair protein RecN (Recombination protein N)
LEQIRLTALGIVGDAELEFTAGLTVLTGETGAGKTMVLTGLGLLLGGRGDATLVRDGADRLLVEGRVRIAPTSAAMHRATDAGAELDQDTLILSRTVAADGRSRAQLGGRSVPVRTLAELADDLVAVHGQADQYRLRRPAAQRQALDAYGGKQILAPLDRYTEAYRRWAAGAAELEQLRAGRARRAAEAQALRDQLAEIDAVAPRPNEAGELSAEISRLAHADALRNAAAEARAALAGADDGEQLGAGGLLAHARRVLEAQRRHDRGVAALADRVSEAAALVADAASDLASYAASIDTDQRRLQTAQERRAALAALERRHGPDVLAWAEHARATLAGLAGDDDRVERLAADQAELLGVLAEQGARLSSARQAAARRLGTHVSAELAELAMPAAQMQVHVRQSEQPHGLAMPDGRHLAFGPNGVDEVELTLRPGPGVDARPLGRAASGGELSRVMLALEVVLAGSDPVPTLIFDEVDAGVGGRAAVEVGRRMARLAEHAQVIAVSHLPQVAAFADRQLVVRRSDDDSVTVSDIVAVDGEQRLRELSRMLAGLEDSALARGHAEELLATAAKAKRPRVR